MSSGDLIQIILYAFALVLLAPVLGQYIARVFVGERHILSRALDWLERGIYRIGGVDSHGEMSWKAYAGALLVFNIFGFLAVFIIQVLQGWLPANPEHLPGVSWHLAFNTAVSFMTNTNWQAYAGETTMSYLTQMVALTVQNFLSAATGIAVVLALTRGIIRRSSRTIGNFWVDMVRSTVYVLLPLSMILAISLVGQGVVQTFSPARAVTTVEGAQQTIPVGPVASQVAIKQLGTNGGGFYNANSTHPLENPTPFSNFLEMLALLLLPASLVFTYGRMVGSRRQSWVIFGVMLLLLLGGLAAALSSEYAHNGVIEASANLEGKETRFGVANSVLWSVATTAASNGSVNAMHDSLTPLAGGVAMFNIMLGEIVFGGVGSGLYGMLLFVLLTVFLAGLMVGRTPEYLGKKIEAREMQMVILAVLAPSAVILIGAGVSCVLPVGLSSLANRGPHGFSEILYAFSSAAGNNGSAFAGLSANTVYYNLTLGLAMLVGRFAVILPCLAIAGSLAAKKYWPPSAGTFATDNATFAVLLISVIAIVGALTFVPALMLGPVVEQFLFVSGQGF
jgi:potassium-transporting ATPase potassium-binding subunit